MTMDFGEVKKALENPKLVGVVPHLGLGDDRNIVVQVYRGEDPEYHMPIYEYHPIDAIGTLFFRGEFTVVIAVGQEAP